MSFWAPSYPGFWEGTACVGVPDPFPVPVTCCAPRQGLAATETTPRLDLVTRRRAPCKPCARSISLRSTFWWQRSKDLIRQRKWQGPSEQIQQIPGAGAVAGDKCGEEERVVGSRAVSAMQWKFSLILRDVTNTAKQRKVQQQSVPTTIRKRMRTQ